MRRLKSCLAAICAIWACNFASAQDRGFASAIEWSPDGETIAIASTTGLWLFDAEFNELGHVQVKQGDFGFAPRSVDWNASGDLVAIGYPRIVTGGPPIQIVDIKRLEVVTEIDPPASLWTQVEWRPTENHLAAGTWTGETFVWDALTGEAVFSFQENDEQTNFSWNSTMAVCWFSKSVIAVITQWETYVVDVELNTVVHSFDIRNLHFPPECNAERKIIDTVEGMFHVEIGAYSETYKPWRDDNDFSLIERIFPESHDFVSEVQDQEFSPDGNKIVSNFEGCRITVFDTRNGRLLALIRGGIYFVQEPLTPFLDSLAWHPDGSRFAAVGQFGGIRIWDAETFDLLQRFDGYKAGYGELSAIFQSRSKHEFKEEDVARIEALESKCITELNSEPAKK